MPKIPKTIRNPYGLSIKQEAVINKVIENVKDGKGLKIKEATRQIYNTKNPDVLASENLARPNFREALLDGLRKKNILGKNSIIENKLNEGLDAVGLTKGGLQFTDYRTRLAYIQEINKIADVYAPERKENKNLNLNINVSPEELDSKIKKLQTELQN